MITLTLELLYLDSLEFYISMVGYSLVLALVWIVIFQWRK